MDLQETNLHYLQSRYYVPEVGRFINADSSTSTGQGFTGNNMFAYCLNNPANGCDPCGTCFHRWDFWNDCDDCGGRTLDEKINAVFKWCEDTYDTAVNFVTNSSPDETQMYLKESGFAFYNGTPVIRIDAIGLNAASFGAVVMGGDLMNSSDFEKTLNHEYGHALQLKKYGLASFAATIAIPSVTANLVDRADLLPWNYYSSPWEYEADLLGGVSRNNYASWTRTVSSIYSYLSVFVGMLP